MALSDADYDANHDPQRRTAAMIDESPQLAAARREASNLAVLLQNERARGAAALAEAKAELSKLERARLIRAGFSSGTVNAHLSPRQVAAVLAELIALECP